MLSPEGSNGKAELWPQTNDKMGEEGQETGPGWVERRPDIKSHGWRRRPSLLQSYCWKSDLKGPRAPPPPRPAMLLSVLVLLGLLGLAAAEPVIYFKEQFLDGGNG